MSFSEQFRKKVNERVNAWKDKRGSLKAEIDKQAALADEYQAAIDKDMEKGPANSKTAENFLNSQYAKRRKAAAENELLDFEKQPIYSLSEYNSLCDEIRDEYRGQINKKLDELAGLIDKSLSLLTDVHEMKKEADNCDKAIRGAFSECGQSAAEIMENSKYDKNHGPGYWVEPTFRTTRTENALKEAKKDLGAKL